MTDWITLVLDSLLAISFGTMACTLFYAGLKSESAARQNVRWHLAAVLTIAALNVIRCGIYPEFEANYRTTFFMLWHSVSAFLVVWMAFYSIRVARQHWLANKNY